MSDWKDPRKELPVHPPRSTKVKLKLINDTEIDAYFHADKGAIHGKYSYPTSWFWRCDGSVWIPDENVKNWRLLT